MNDSAHASSPYPIVAVGAVVWNASGEVVLIRRGKPPLQGEWSIPGGRVEWGETLQDAVLREILEETGLSVEIVGPIETVDAVTRNEAGGVLRHYVLCDFAARAVAGVLKAGSDAEDAIWVPLSRIGEYGLWNETRRIIEKSAALLCASSP